MQDRLILAMDAAGDTCSVALGRATADGLILLAARKIDQKHGQAAVLVPMIQTVMGEAGSALSALDSIAVGIGPGGFTGLRIALATARGLGLALDKPVIGISNFQAAAAHLPAAMLQDLPGTLVVDVEGYRARGEGQLRLLAKRLAEQAVNTGKRQVLEPMPASERRIIHIELRDREHVTTQSIGEESRRKVTIIPKD